MSCTRKISGNSHDRRESAPTSVEGKTMFSIFRQKELSFTKHDLPGLHKNMIRLSFSFLCLWVLWFNFSLFKKSQFFNRELTKCPVIFFSLLDLFLVLYCSFLSEVGGGGNKSSPTQCKRGKDHTKFLANPRDHEKNREPNGGVRYILSWFNQNPPHPPHPFPSPHRTPPKAINNDPYLISFFFFTVCSFLLSPPLCGFWS